MSLIPPAARALAALALGLLLVACDATEPPPGPLDLAAPWAETSPEGAGLDRAAVEAAVDRLAAMPRARSVLAVRGGRIAVERYFHGADRRTLHDVRSVTKTVVGMLAGIAIAEGAVGLDTAIGPLLDPVAEVPASHAAVTVGQLTTMTSGIAWNELSGPSYADWITSGAHLQYVLDQPLEHPPGTDFTYNSGAVHVLGVVLEEAVGEPLPSYADRVLFGPLGIEAREWEALSGGRVNGGAGLDLRARDLARLGLLILQDGRSGDQTVLPAGWVDGWTGPAQPWRASSDAVGAYTYGRLVWSVDGPPRGALAWGYGGQFVYVVPALDLVLVATTDWRGVSADGGANPLEAAVLAVLADVAAAAH